MSFEFEHAHTEASCRSNTSRIMQDVPSRHGQLYRSHVVLTIRLRYSKPRKALRHMVVVRVMFLLPVWTMYMSGSYQFISQAGWNICDLLYSFPAYTAISTAA